MKTLKVSTDSHWVGNDDGVTLVIAWGNATVHCVNKENKLTVLLFDSARCHSRDNCHVIASDQTRVWAYGGTVEALKESAIEAHLDTFVMARDTSSVTAHDVVTGYVLDRAELRAFGRSKILVMSHGRVEVRDYAEIDYTPLGGQQSLKISGDSFDKIFRALENVIVKADLSGKNRDALRQFRRELISQELTSLTDKFTTSKWATVMAIPQVRAILTSFGFKIEGFF